MTGFFDEDHYKDCGERGQATLDEEHDLGPD